MNEKLDKKNKDVIQDFEKFDTKKEPKKSLQTFLRNQNKSYLNSMNMIDRKSAIMIRINSTIISGFVIFFDQAKQIPMGDVIGLVLIFCCFFSLMSALNSSRPHTFDVLLFYKKNMQKKNTLEKNIFMLGANTDNSLEEYEDAFDKIVKDQSLQIGNQVKHMWLFEKRIRASYAQIEISYVLFMLGFLISIILFFIGQYQIGEI